MTNIECGMSNVEVRGEIPTTKNAKSAEKRETFDTQLET